jgi:hypothetical protein
MTTLAKPDGHEYWEDIENQVVRDDLWWTGYLKINGGWLVKAVRSSAIKGGPFGLSITFVPDPDHNRPPVH